MKKVLNCRYILAVLLSTFMSLTTKGQDIEFAGFQQSADSVSFQSHSDVIVISSYVQTYDWSSGIIKYLSNDYSEQTNHTVSSIEIPVMMIRNQEDADATISAMNFFVKSKTPDVIVLLGNSSLNLIDGLHNSFPDLPMVFIAGSETTIKNEFLFDNNTYEIDDTLRFSEIRERTGVTSVILPVFIREEIDLIVRLRPELTMLYFIGGEDSFSKMLDKQIKDYLNEKYPSLQARSITPDRLNYNDVLNITGNSDADKCAAIYCSWVNRDDVNNGSSILMNNFLYTISAQNIPLFVIRDNGWMEHSKDILGGCFTTDEYDFSLIEKQLNVILSGKSSASTEPIRGEKFIYKLNYVKMKKFGISQYDCPPSTVFVDSPGSIVERNPILVAVYIIVFSAILILLVLIIRFFRNKFNNIKNQENYFINALPMTFIELEPIFSTDGIVRDGLITKLNKMAEELIGKDSIGKRISHIYPFTYKEIFTKINMSTKNTNIGTEFDLYLKQSDQYLIFIAVLLENGKIGLACLDNSAAAKANRVNKEVTEFMQKQQQFLEYLPYSYIVFSLIKDKKGKVIDGEVEYYNHHVSQMIGKSGHSIMGVSAKKMWPNLFKNSISQLNAALKSNTPASLEAVYSTKYNRYFDMVFRITDSDHVGVMLIDRTNELTSKDQIVKTNEELVIAKERAEASERAKNSMIHNMSHEIRTPLNAIVGFSQLLSMPDSFITEDEKTEYRDYIVNSSEMLSMLIDDMLDLSDNKTDKYRVQFTDCYCNQICQKANKIVGYRIPEGVNLEFQTDVDDDFVIKSDPKRIQQVLINFLTNASKHTESGYIRTGISKTMNPGKITLYVEDTGCGVDPVYAEKIFEKFVMLNPDKEGKGLGLRICRDVADLLGGVVLLDTSYKTGARFLFILNMD